MCFLQRKELLGYISSITERDSVEGEKQVSLSSAVVKLGLHHGPLMEKGKS